MIRFFIYTVSENRMIGSVMAKDWVDARLEASRAFGFSFAQIFACQNPPAKDVAAKLVRMMPGAEVFGVTGGGVGVSLGGYAETGRKDNYSHAGVMNDSITLHHEAGPSLRGKFDTLPGHEDAFGDGHDDIVVKTDGGRINAFRVPWTGSADEAAREIAKRLLKGK